ncbi:MAG: CvpA family protein [Candidatus Brocadiia bacterium]
MQDWLSNGAMIVWEDTTYLDAVLLFLCVAISIRGLWSGFICEFGRMAGWIAAFWGAGRYHPYVAEMMGEWFSAQIRIFIAFLAVFVVILSIVYLVEHLLHFALDALYLTSVDRILGLLMGLIKGVFFCAVISLAVLKYLPADSTLYEMFEESQSGPVLARGASLLWLLLPWHGEF